MYGICSIMISITFCRLIAVSLCPECVVESALMNEGVRVDGCLGGHGRYHRVLGGLAYLRGQDVFIWSSLELGGLKVI